MNTLEWLLTTAAVGGIAWSGRRVPLPADRRRLAVAARAGAVVCVCAALWGGCTRVVTKVQPQRVVYVVDRSDSMDPRQQAWVAARIASLDARRPAQVPRAIVAFGAGASVAEPLGQARLDDPARIRAALQAVSVDGRQTQLEGALFEALGLLPGGGGRVILFSDGRETSGSIQRVLPHLRRLGLSVYPEPVSVQSAETATWESLVVPPAADRGGSIPIRVVVHHAGDRNAAGTVTVGLAGVPLQSRRIVLRPGWQVITASVPAIQTGAAQVDVSLNVPAAGLQETRQAFTQVQGPPRVLVVDEDPGSLPWVAAALKRREMDITLARPSDLSADPAALQPYDAMVLASVPKSAITQPQAEAVQAYLQGGGGLVMVGLGGDVAAEVAAPAPIDAVLPVTFDAKGLQEAHRRVCMVMLIDRSASMLGARLAATKRAAVELVNQLQPEDLAGVFAFDARAYVVVEVQPVGQARQVIVDKLVMLHSSGGTDAYPAFMVAKSRLDATDAKVKHILLLSDGNTPFRKEAYHALVESFRRDGVTVSTIGVGSAFINEDYLQWIAGATGGTYYQLRSLDDLPKLVARDTKDRLGTLPYTEGLYRPTRSPTAEWFEDVREWPSLKGYFTATPKPGAQVDLLVQAGDAPDPLLARWTVGLGRVAVFTSDAEARWSPRWIEWPGFEAFWSQVVRWAMRPRIEEELFVWVDRGRGVPQLVLEGMLQDPRGHLQDAAGAQATPLSLVQTGPWRWTASLEGLAAGWYQLVLESHDGNHAAFASRWIQVGSPAAVLERPGQAPNEPLLRELADATGGIYGSGDAAFLPPAVPVTSREPLLSLWVLAALALLLVDVAIRGSTML